MKCLAVGYTSTLATARLLCWAGVGALASLAGQTSVFFFSRKLEVKRPRGTQRTHPNVFWPGHLLDKLQLYLPTVAVDRSLALFSCVQPQPSAYSATYHPHHWWPIGNMNYMTCAYYDAPKVYYIN